MVWKGFVLVNLLELEIIQELENVKNSQVLVEVVISNLLRHIWLVL
jgi:hypothetical protein